MSNNWSDDKYTSSSGETASLISCNKNFNENELNFVRKIFNKVGEVYELKLSHLDALMEIWGSDSAYYFIIIEALAEGGVKRDFPREIS
jgi:pyrroline-5-carboxylate reductase